MKYKNKSWQEIAEYAFLASSAAGTIVAVASQQAAYAAAPLTLALCLSVSNRQKFQQQTQLHNSRAIAQVHQVVESLNQQIHALPAQPANLDPITQSLELLEYKIQKLAQDFDNRLEPQEIAQIKNQLNALVRQLNNLEDTIEPADLSGMKADLANLQVHLQAIDSSSGSRRIDHLQNQIKQIGQQIQDLSPPFDPSALKQQIAALQQYLEQHSLTEPFDPTALNPGMENLSLSIVHLSQSVTGDIASVRQQILAEIEAQHTSVLSRLEPLEAIDYSLQTSAITQLKIDLPELEHNTQEAIGQLTNKLGSLALRLDNLPTPPEPVDLSGIEGAITLLSSENANLNCQLIHLTQQFNTRLEATEIQCLGEIIGSAIQRLDELEQQQQNLGEISEIQQQLKDLDASAANLHNYAQQLKHDLGGQINQLHLVTSALDERSQMLIEIPQQLDDIKQPNAGLDERTTTLDERIKTLAQMEQQAKVVQQSIPVLHEKVEHLLNQALDRDDIQQQLSSLWQLTNESMKAVDLESKLVGLSEASVTKHELDALTQLFIQEIEQLSCVIANLRSPTPQFDPLPLTAQIANLAERVDKLPFLQQQLAEVHKSIEDLDTSQEVLHDRTRNLDQMQSRLENLQRSLTEYVKKESLKDILSRLYQEFSNRVDVTVEEQTTKLNHLLRETQTNYKYELVFDRCGSRNVLLEALQQAEHRLILVCPWLTIKGADYQVLHKCRTLLEQGVQLDIGWGHLKDIDDDKLGTGFFYNALNNFKKLAVEYPNLCNLKLLGTHEKFLVCDRSFAMLGSHNFLTSGNHSNERELGLLTNDTRIIADLIGRFDNARNLKFTSWIE